MSLPFRPSLRFASVAPARIPGISPVACGLGKDFGHGESMLYPAEGVKRDLTIRRGVP